MWSYMYQSATMAMVLLNKYLLIICNPMLYVSLGWAEGLAGLCSEALPHAFGGLRICSLGSSHSRVYMKKNSPACCMPLLITEVRNGKWMTTHAASKSCHLDVVPLHTEIPSKSQSPPLCQRQREVNSVFKVQKWRK